MGNGRAMPSREERVAENETHFRKANEALLEKWGELELVPAHTTLFICECGDLRCTDVIRMTVDEYEAVRGDANTFAIVPGHDDRSTEEVVEGVVEENDRFSVVKKRDAYRQATEATDPR
jgi:hypothetical protein